MPSLRCHVVVKTAVCLEVELTFGTLTKRVIFFWKTGIHNKDQNKKHPPTRSLIMTTFALIICLGSPWAGASFESSDLCSGRTVRGSTGTLGWALRLLSAHWSSIPASFCQGPRFLPGTCPHPSPQPTISLCFCGTLITVTVVNTFYNKEYWCWSLHLIPVTKH